VDLGAPFNTGRHLKIELSVPEFISSLVPADILEPFQTLSPFPLIVVAVIMTYAFCFSERHFDRMMNVVHMCYSLFSKMLEIIMSVLPVFIIAAFLDLYLSDGYIILLYLGILSFGVVVSTFVMIGYYSVRIMAKNIPVIPFLKKLAPLLYENIKINSPIDAAPYNIRYCESSFNMDRRELEVSMPMLAQINLDGNCFFIMLIMLLIMLEYHDHVSALNVATVALIVLFLSLGAPNQPGSLLITMAVILNYMNSNDLIPLAFICEVFYGRLLNVVNVMGDVVTAVEKQEKQTGY
jgi:Na+/H+-dicarboxylate symporter